ncbi:MAG: nucleoside triphosphate pyrophosphatase [Alphaproteobacteria bacterium]
MSNSFILASSSPRRIELLEQINYSPCAIIPAHIDETPLPNELPPIYAKRMAETKAEKILNENPDAVILASDTVVACGRRILPKAETEQDAQKCLNSISGKSHRVYSSICLMSKDFKTTKTVLTRVTFKRLSTREKNEYLASNEWEGKAGGYAIQGMAGAYVKKISGSYSNVVGLPLCETANILSGKSIYPDIKRK